MKAIEDFISGITAGFYGASQILGYIRTLAWWALLTPKAQLAARLVAVKSQLAMHTLRIRQKQEVPVQSLTSKVKR